MALAGGEGELFSWGHDGYGQLGQGVTMITSPESVPHMIRGSLVGAKVTQVACGGHHTLALTATGQVKGGLEHRSVYHHYVKASSTTNL